MMSVVCLYSSALEHADTPQTLTLLRVRPDWPYGSGTANKRDELTPLHRLPLTSSGRH